MRVRKSASELCLLYVAGLALSLAGPSLLPDNYYLDPDFGSFAKHETILLPMLFYVLVQHGVRRSAEPARTGASATTASR